MFHRMVNINRWCDMIWVVKFFFLLNVVWKKSWMKFKIEEMKIDYRVSYTQISGTAYRVSDIRTRVNLIKIWDIRGTMTQYISYL